MELNFLGGRAYADVTQYPIFPWTLINFNQPKCNLADEKSYRNLNLPLGALGSEERVHTF